MSRKDSPTAPDDVDKENRALKRKVAQLERNMRRLEGYHEHNAALLRTVMEELDAEKAKSEELILNILPQQIVSRLNTGEKDIADRFDDITVVFSDFAGFTEISARTPPSRLVRALNEVFSEFDSLTQTIGVEKIKTIGDAYLAVAGLPDARPDHCEAAGELALGMVRVVADVKPDLDAEFNIRIGMHTGAVMAGLIGTHKFVYDVWGDTVNLASRLEGSSEPGHIHISEAVARLLRFDYEVEPRGTIDLKGKGEMETFYLTGRKSSEP